MKHLPEWGDAILVAVVLAAVVALSFPASGQLPVPVPIPVPTPTPTSTPMPDSFWTALLNAEFVKAIGGPLGFFALLMFAALAYVWWKQLKQPSQQDQVHILRWMYHDAVERNARLRKVLGTFCEIVTVFADAAHVDVKDKVEKIQDRLNTGPPPTPEMLQIPIDDSREDT